MNKEPGNLDRSKIFTENWLESGITPADRVHPSPARDEHLMATVEVGDTVDFEFDGIWQIGIVVRVIVGGNLDIETMTDCYGYVPASSVTKR